MNIYYYNIILKGCMTMTLFCRSDANKLLNLIHLGQQLLILPIYEVDLALLACDLLLCLLLVEI